MHKTICWSPPATNHFSKLFFHHHIKLCAGLPAAMNNRGLLPITPSIIEAKAVGICLNEERSSAESFSIPLAVSKREPCVETIFFWTLAGHVLRALKLDSTSQSWIDLCHSCHFACRPAREPGTSPWHRPRKGFPLHPDQGSRRAKRNASILARL